MTPADDRFLRAFVMRAGARTLRSRPATSSRSECTCDRAAVAYTRSDVIEIEVDGQKVEVPEGSMLMEAANRLDIYVPHFCYHRKLSIAANCRMCLVEVEKAPKPLPACATPVTAGMIVRTQSRRPSRRRKR